MANIFKNSLQSSIGVTGIVAYTAPVATTATVIGVSVANINTSNINVSVMLRDVSSNKTVHLVKNALITPGGTAVLVGGEQKIVIEAGDFLSVTSSLASSADVIVSVLELS
jgi:hypothetical protein